MEKSDKIEQNGYKAFTFDRVVRIVFTIAIITGALMLIHRLSSVLLPFFIAWLVAYIIEPVVQMNRKIVRTKGRFFPVILTLLEATIVIVGLGFLFAPSIISEAQQINVIISDYVNDPNHEEFLSPEIRQYINDHLNFDRLVQRMTGQDWRSLFDTVVGFIAQGISFIMSFVGWFLTLVYLLFIMLEYDKLAYGLKRMVPTKYKKTTFTIFDHIKNSIGFYFRGQSLIALMVGILFSIGFLIIDLPLAIVLGLFIGLLNMVPYLQLVSIPIATLLCVFTSMSTGIPFWPYWGKCMAVYVIVQSLQDLVITPKVMGKAMNLNPVLIFLSLSVWGSLLGFIGLVIALPLTALIIALYYEYVIKVDDERNPKDAKKDLEALDDIIEEKE